MNIMVLKRYRIPVGQRYTSPKAIEEAAGGEAEEAKEEASKAEISQFKWAQMTCILCAGGFQHFVWSDQSKKDKEDDTNI